MIPLYQRGLICLFIDRVGDVRRQGEVRGMFDLMFFWQMNFSPCAPLGGQRVNCRHSGSAEPVGDFQQAANGIMIIPDTKQKVFYF